MTDDRKPCPFCESTKLSMQDMPSGGETFYNAMCLNCWAVGPNKPTRREAWDAWNKRIETPVKERDDS